MITTYTCVTLTDFTSRYILYITNVDEKQQVCFYYVMEVVHMES